ncbi:hypothetical protein OB955_18245 [Halobacteria archaeon AArc-m2/3/4]|uniref:Uncharacterized protein n=1 Tax=Natronoglomus mannanivorans TaxID=2979990 RepID=A0AAP2Z4J0_9EURY|nr:hypothetical protein [Halobacteria archaeon AArc-xg1-1]MCU4974663.1 hypothetical protein [Halobacteria archaeon AArc-m2/3/4]
MASDDSGGRSRSDSGVDSDSSSGSDSRTGSGSDSTPEATPSLEAPSVEDTTGYGLTLTLIGGVLLALAYYGVLAIQGTHQLGQAMPEPFYGLALAVLFVLELLNSRHLGVLALARAIAFTAVYGALFVFAVEGGASLWANPDLALEGYAGVTVLAVALVVAALLYVGYLTVVESDRNRGAGG